MTYADLRPTARDPSLTPDVGLATATFEDLDTSLVDGCARARTALRGWVTLAATTTATGEGAPAAGISLKGDTGTGKTHLLTAAARKLAALLDPRIASNPYRVLLLSEVGLHSHLRESWSRGDSADRLRRAIAGANRSWLFLDDLGATRGDERFAQEVADLLMRRHASPYRALTVITTNLSLPQIEQVYGARVASRLYESLLVFKLDGDDQRSPR